ncbi:YetF domain-containing protein [Alteribacillus sp. JSM 102045]|uniref:YetF domain-containing protein n=1 Tax=Alteribacillus sp. JSM 102045 TaxID=1562101 RepID=UPI0035BF8CC5
MILWGGLLFLVEYLSQKSLPFRNTFDGKPSLIIRNGKIDFEELKHNRMNINQLQSLLRQSEVFLYRK